MYVCQVIFPANDQQQVAIFNTPRERPVRLKNAERTNTWGYWTNKYFYSYNIKNKYFYSNWNWKTMLCKLSGSLKKVESLLVCYQNLVQNPSLWPFKTNLAKKTIKFLKKKKNKYKCKAFFVFVIVVFVVAILWRKKHIPFLNKIWYKIRGFFLF